MFRFFTVYGPWGRPDMALFKFTDAILEGRPVDAYGKGRMARDFTYVDDLVEAVVRLVDTVPNEAGHVVAPGVVDIPSHVAPYRVVNIAGGTSIDLLDFVRTVERSTGLSATLNLMPMQAGDVRRTFADNGLLRALIDYAPNTPIDTGVAAFVKWYREYRT